MARGKATKKRGAKKQPVSTPQVVTSDDETTQPPTPTLTQDPEHPEDEAAPEAAGKRKRGDSPSASTPKAKRQLTEQEEKLEARRKLKNQNRRKAPAEAIKDLEKWKTIVLKSYIPGINIIADKAQLHKKQKELAGYLGLDNTQLLADMVTRHWDALEEFVKSRQSGFDVPGWKGTSTLPDNVILDDIRKATPGDRWYDLLTIKQSVLVQECCPSWQDLQVDSAFARACYITAMIYLIRTDDKVFRESFDRSQAVEDRWLGILSPEDCYRALKFIRYFDACYQLNKDEKYKPTDLPSVPMQYLTAEEVEQATKAANVRDTRAPITDAKAQAQLFYEQLSMWGDPVHLSTAAPTDRFVDELGKAGDMLDATTAALTSDQVSTSLSTRHM